MMNERELRKEEGARELELTDYLKLIIVLQDDGCNLEYQTDVKRHSGGHSVSSVYEAPIEIFHSGYGDDIDGFIANGILYNVADFTRIRRD